MGKLELTPINNRSQVSARVPSTHTTQKIETAMSGSEYTFPAFDDLPKIEGMPQGSIWGFYDKDGKKDEVGGLSTSSYNSLP